MRKVPILVLAFNRADHVAEAMTAIREYKPARLYLECDGPRAYKKGEWEAVELTRKTMLDSIDWPCDVKTLFREENLGCANAVYGAISWFFENEEFGVIVEDDMVIGKDFFLLCEELLPRYSDDERVMTIQAMNKSHRTDIPNSYVFSYSSGCWGWASWRRAWSKMDMSMSSLPSLSYWTMIRKIGFLPALYLMHQYWSGYRHLDSFSSWAYRWSLSVQAHNGLSIFPGVNLAINIGTDGGAHYSDKDIDPYKDLVINNIEWPLVYNDSFCPERKQRRYDIKDFYRLRMIGVRKRIKKIISKTK